MSRLCRLKTASHGEDGKWAHGEIIRLRAENEALRRDAERYRWFRAHLDDVDALTELYKYAGDIPTAEELDAAIDAAMTK